MPFETVREQLMHASKVHRALYRRYTKLAAQTSDDRQRLLQTLATQEQIFAEGLERFAAQRDPVLDTWLQYPTRPGELEPMRTGDLHEIVERAARWDELISEIYRPLRTVESQEIQDLCDTLDETRIARARARARLVALGQP